LGKALLAYSTPDYIQENLDKLNLENYTDTTISNENDLLVHLEDVRQRGYALDMGEHEKEVRCVAAPIFDQYGKTVAAISVSGPSGRIDPVEQNTELIDKTLSAAEKISEKLGYRKEIT
jgi:IclR family acetate operon transcriptional repressor